jgi:hypothetical protein
MNRINFALTALLAGILAAPAESQAPLPPPSLSYADLADLSLEAPVVAKVRIVRASRLKPAEAPGLLPGRTRFYVEAEVVSLIRASGELPAQVNYLVDLANLPGGKPAQLRKKEERLIFAAPVPNRPGTLRLVGPDAQIVMAPAMLSACAACCAKPPPRARRPESAASAKPFTCPVRSPARAKPRSS